MSTLSASGAWALGLRRRRAPPRSPGAALTGRGRYAPTAEGDEARLFGALKIAGDERRAARRAHRPRAGRRRRSGRSTPRPTSPCAASAGTFRASPRPSRGSRRAARSPTSRRRKGPNRIASPDLQRAEDAVDGPAGAQPPAPAALTGDLSFDRLRFADLAALALGPPQPARRGQGMVGGEIRRAAAGPARRRRAGPRRDAEPYRRARRAGLLDQPPFRQGAARSRRRSPCRSTAAPSRATRRCGAAARPRRSTGRWRSSPSPSTRPGFSGRIGGRLDFASTGRSPAALIAGLAGGGTAEFAGAALARSDPAALERVVGGGAGARGRDRRDQRRLPVRRRARQRRARDPRRSGAARAERRDDQARPDRLSSSARRGDADCELRPRAARRSRRGSRSRSGDRPQVLVGADRRARSSTVEDALDAPKRRIDVAALAAGLATQAIARESDRIATLEADIRERAFFNRRLKGERFLDRRNAEIEDWRAEQERLKGLAEHLAAQRAEEARLAAEKAAAEKAAAERARGREGGGGEGAAARRNASPAVRDGRRTSPDLPPAPRRAGGGASTRTRRAGRAPAPPPRPKPRPPRRATARRPPSRPQAASTDASRLGRSLARPFRGRRPCSADDRLASPRARVDLGGERR